MFKRFGVILFTFLLLGLPLVTDSVAMTEEYAPTVNMSRIKSIESSGRPHAFNKRSGARGLYQITPIVLKEWNNFHPSETYTLEDLFNPTVNEKIAKWYLTKRIPQMLRHFKKPLTIENLLISYNAGINYVVTGNSLPSETVQYLQKYNSKL